MQTLLLAQVVKLNPNPGKGPGGPVLQTLADWIGGIALVVCLIALLVGAAMWALGSHGNNYSQTATGKRAVLISGGAALVIGAGAALVNFMYGLGSQV